MKVIAIFISILAMSSNLFSQEICDNGIDDDGDGLIDYQDTNDCFCEGDINYSLIPNSSFEDTVYCPSSLSQMTRAVGWLQGSSATSDYYNTCGYTLFSLHFPAPLPLPEGNGYVGFVNSSIPGNYKEYVAICLSDTLFAGEKYKIKFKIALGLGNPITTVGIFGSSNCANLPFGLSPISYECPTYYPNFIALDSITITTNNRSWQSSSFSFTAPIDITNFIIGPSCAKMSGSNYYYFDIVEHHSIIELEMPNVFSPNNDSKNDFFRPIKSSCFNNFNFFIYNRWGQKVYETNSLPISWDGTTNGKMCSEGVYFWVLKSNNDERNLKGNISLFR